MALTEFESGNVVQQWEDEFHEEFTRDSLFKRFTGRGSNNIFQLNGKLDGMPGDKITFSVVRALSGPGVMNDALLTDNEEAGQNFSHQVTVNQYRNAVKVGKHEQKKGHIDLLKAYRDQLMIWARSHRRDQCIAALMSANTDGTTAYNDCTAAQRNAWLTANSDRAIYGSALGNNSSLVHATALGLIDTTNDTLSWDLVELAYREARNASPRIRPYVAKEDEEWYVLFTESYAFRDLKASPSYQQAARDAGPRGEDNPLFRPGDIIVGGVLCREIPEMSANTSASSSPGTIIQDVGDSSSDVSGNFLCGAQAVLIAEGDKIHAIDEDRDYGNRRGVGVAKTDGVEKTTYNSIQHGVVTLFVSATADA